MSARPRPLQVWGLADANTEGPSIPATRARNASSTRSKVGEPNRYEDLKRSLGLPGLHQIAEAEGLHRTGTKWDRVECPGCRNGDPRGASLGEKDGVVVWHCFRDDSHRGSVIDFLALARGIDAGRALEELEHRAGIDLAKSVRLLPRPAPKPQAPPRRPPAGEVAEVWALCRPLLDVADVAQAWAARGLNVATVEERDLARVLPHRVPLPAWASGPGGSWSRGPHRLILPLYDPAGKMVSLHARAVRAFGALPKGLSPGGFRLGGLVFADGLARQVLAGHGHDLLTRAFLLIAEGGPDFLSAATQASDADESAPAVLGIISGSWAEEVAGRVPDNTRVLLAVHRDDAGEKYATAVRRTLGDRCQLRRLQHGSAA
jgi:hypothetical protein